jgi:DNA (cytosine-5)-methyltransferase 1
MNELDDKQSLNELHLFAGAGGGILASELLGHRTICAVEFNEYARNVLVARQNDGTFPPFPVWDDVRTFDGKPWRGIVDIVSGGFPCQDISVAGKGAGLDGERSGLWSEFARIIGEVRPRYAFIENSPMLTNRGLDRVLCDLAAMGFDAEWGVLSAADVGANHLRERIWILGYSNINSQSNESQHDETSGLCDVANTVNGRCGETVSGVDGKTVRVSQKDRAERSWSGMPERTSGMVEWWRANSLHNPRELANTDGTHGERNKRAERGEQERAVTFESSWWKAEPELGRVVDELAYRSHRLTAIGNGQVPLCAATAFRLLKARIGH